MDIVEYKKKLSLTWLLRSQQITRRTYGREIVKRLPDGNEVLVVDFTNTSDNLQCPIRYEQRNSATLYPLFNVESTLLIRPGNMVYELDDSFQLTYDTWFMPILPKQAWYRKAGYLVCY